MSEEKQHPCRVACVGASLVFGRGLENRREECFPAVLGRLLGGAYQVRNFGYSGATAGRETNEPYWQTASFTSANRFAAEIALVSLGTNDAQHANLANLPNFRADYTDLIEHFRRLRSGAQVVVVIPPPVFEPLPEIDIAALDAEVRPAIIEVAAELGLPTLDGQELFAGRGELFPDNLHPNAEGARMVGQAAYEVVREL
ncbi:Acetylxylan esterase precursor [Posidoniimonas polymericola]|uniref:Acetylxylan esterase n=1 Tax=Posidoniimonas polymericola TaxID=2528002 RepID=A0A5C5YRB5_9BACT|nr:GDSL-type esterase/lipase family protein [Posidoniimonas polymericola]TWT77378.1 Acetylxylan esterase precursor [Posidoniimonas polymericola]